MKVGVVLFSLASFALPSIVEAASNPTPAALTSNSSVLGSLSQDEIAIYETVLASWFDGNWERQLVDYRLGTSPSATDSQLLKCTKGLRFPGDTGRVQGQKSLVGVQFHGGEIELTDGSKWNPNDPGQAIANGQPVGSAVSEGIAHSLISFSQIAFSDDGNDALVKFAMVCGRLCGIGSTIHLRKSATEWKIVDRCASSIS